MLKWLKKGKIWHRFSVSVASRLSGFERKLFKSSDIRREWIWLACVCWVRYVAIPPLILQWVHKVSNLALIFDHHSFEREQHFWNIKQIRRAMITVLRSIKIWYSSVLIIQTRNSSGDEIANVNFLCDDVVHALKYNRLLHKFRHTSFSATQVYQIQWNYAM